MIKYNYKIERNEEDEWQTYKPKNFPTELPNLVSVEGPNSSGKSTLLHLLALSCFGEKNPQIKESLKTKIKSLLDIDHQKLTFEIEIFDKDNKLELRSKKSDINTNDFEVRDGKDNLITQHNFINKYKLIYDIPEDPLSRLDDLLDGIIEIQTWLYERHSALIGKLANIIGDIQAARNPEKIEDLKKEISEMTRKEKSTQQQVSAYEDRLKEIKYYTYLNFYEFHKNNTEAIAKDLLKYSKEDSKKKIEKKKISKASDELSRRVTDETIIITEFYQSVSAFLEKNFAKGQEKNHFDIWKNIDIRDELLNDKLKRNLLHESTHFKDILERELEVNKGEGDFEKASVFEGVISSLRNYSNNEINIPKLDISIAKLVEILNQELDKYRDILVRNNYLEKTISDLESIIESRKLICEELIPKLKTLAGNEDELSDDVKDETEYYHISKLNNNLESHQKKVDFYKIECAKMGVEEDEIRSLYSSVVLGRANKELEHFSEADLIEKIHNLKKDISENKEGLGTYKSNISYLDDDLKKLENKEPHKYHDHLSYLKQKLEQVQAMQKKTHTFNLYIKDLKSKKQNTNVNTEEKEIYYNEISTYLANRVGTIKHIDKEYQLKSINLINQEIVTAGGKTIRTVDMGTGEGHSAYLKGLLGAYDGRKIIALFDEVAMMDTKSIEPVSLKLKELYENGRLLVGIIVQKSDRISTKPI